MSAATRRAMSELHEAANTLYDIDRWTDDLARLDLPVSIVGLRAAVAELTLQVQRAAEDAGVQL